MRIIVDREVEKMLDLNVIELLDSFYSLLVVFVKKKDDFY